MKATPCYKLLTQQAFIYLRSFALIFKIDLTVTKLKFGIPWSMIIWNVHHEHTRFCIDETARLCCAGGGAYCASLYSAPPCKLDRVESLYGGTKSMYAKSPPLTRANLNRSQSVYTKSSGPIVPRGEGTWTLAGPFNYICENNIE